MSDYELNKLFAEKIVGCRVVTVEDVNANRADARAWFMPNAARAWKNRWKNGCAVIQIPDFTTDTNAVLPWLEKEFAIVEWRPGKQLGFLRHGGRNMDWAIAPTFAMAAVLALLTAKGIELPRLRL